MTSRNMSGAIIDYWEDRARPVVDWIETGLHFNQAHRRDQGVQCGPHHGIQKFRMTKSETALFNNMPCWGSYDYCDQFEASLWELIEAGTSLSLLPLPGPERTVAVQIRDGNVGLCQVVSQQAALQALLNETVFSLKALLSNDIMSSSSPLVVTKKALLALRNALQTNNCAQNDMTRALATLECHRPTRAWQGCLFSVFKASQAALDRVSDTIRNALSLLNASRDRMDLLTVHLDAIQLLLAESAPGHPDPEVCSLLVDSLRILTSPAPTLDPGMPSLMGREMFETRPGHPTVTVWLTLVVIISAQAWAGPLLLVPYWGLITSRPMAFLWISSTAASIILFVMRQ